VEGGCSARLLLCPCTVCVCQKAAGKESNDRARHPPVAPARAGWGKLQFPYRSTAYVYPQSYRVTIVCCSRVVSKYRVGPRVLMPTDVIVRDAAHGYNSKRLPPCIFALHLPPGFCWPSDATTIGRQKRGDPRQTPTARPLRRGPQVAQAEGVGGGKEEGRLGSVVWAKQQQQQQQQQQRTKAVTYERVWERGRVVRRRVLRGGPNFVEWCFVNGRVHLGLVSFRTRLDLDGGYPPCVKHSSANELSMSCFRHPCLSCWIDASNSHTVGGNWLFLVDGGYSYSIENECNHSAVVIGRVL